MSTDVMANRHRADRELLYEILYTLKTGEDSDRNYAIENKVPKLADKQAARDEFIRLLKYGEPDSQTGQDTLGSDEEYHNAEVRSWASGALAKLSGKEDKKARDAIIDCLEKETVSVHRRWILLRLYEMGSQQDIEPTVRRIADAYRGDQQDTDNSRSGPLALAILASWSDRVAAEDLEKKLKSKDLDTQWEVCRVVGLIRSCRDMLEPLMQVAVDPATWVGIRLESVKAIGQIESPGAMRALGRVLATERDAFVKEAAIEGLERLSQSRPLRRIVSQLEKVGEIPYWGVAEAIMGALLDDNAQIRHRAAKALSKVMIDLDTYDDGDEEAYEKAVAQARTAAAEKVVGELVRDTVDLANGVPLLVDALRQIDPPEAEAAASVLRQYLFSEDVSVKQRAEQALRLVGGERALQTLMGQKSEVLRTYSDLLAKADEPIQLLFQETMHQAQTSFRISQWMTIIVFGIGVGVLIAGLSLAFIGGESSVQRVFGAGTSIVGVTAIVLDLLVRDPHRRVQESTSVLLRIKVIFLGYLRQVHQIDATFKHEFIEGGREFGVREAQETSRQISVVMKNTMNMIDLHLPVRKSDKLAVDEALKTWQERLQAATESGEKPEKPHKDKESGNTSGDAG